MGTRVVMQPLCLQRALVLPRRRPGSKLTLLNLDSRSRWRPHSGRGNGGDKLSVVAVRQNPMRVAEQRSKRGSSPRGLFEGEHRINLFVPHLHKPEFRSGPRLCAAQGTPTALSSGRRTWGCFSLDTFFCRSKRKYLAVGQPPTSKRK